MDTNIIYNIDCVAGMNQMIDEASIDLIIADPPYFKVIGEKWDYLWRTEEDYFHFVLTHFDVFYNRLLEVMQCTLNICRLRLAAP